jgi:hypothetical protein
MKRARGEGCLIAIYGLPMRVGSEPMAKVLFIPVSVISGLIAGFLGRTVFDSIWGLIDDREPPDAGDREIELPKLAVALAAQGAIFSITRGLADHFARRAFYNATGSWPGEEKPDEA